MPQMVWREKRESQAWRVELCNLGWIGQVRSGSLCHDAGGLETCDLTHAFITSRIDYCNSILYSFKVLNKLQYIQYSAARLLTHSAPMTTLSLSSRTSTGSPFHNRSNLKSFSSLTKPSITRPPPTSLSCSTTTFLPTASAPLMITSCLHHSGPSTGHGVTELTP